MEYSRDWIKSPFLRMFLLLLRITSIILHFWDGTSSGTELRSKATCRILFLSSQESLRSFPFLTLLLARKLRERERLATTRDGKRDGKVRDGLRDVNFIPANQGTGWSRSALSSAVDDEKKITKSTTIRFLDCQSSVPLVRSVKLISRNRYMWLSDILYTNAC